MKGRGTKGEGLVNSLGLNELNKRGCQMSNTQENLQAAFAGESQANRSYLFFADKADKDGYSQNLRTMGGIKSTKENLEAAVGGEHHEFTSMYPGFIEQAKSENNKAAQTTFDWANQVEEIHHSLYQEAVKALESGQSLKDEPYFVCQGCGNTVGGEAPDKCPVCGAPKSLFKRVE